MREPPQLTVSMPARNTAHFIGEAIESVLRQTGVDLELIVVDDASEDDTAAVVEAFEDPRVRLIRNRRRRGIGACHNLVLDESSSPYIAHVDSDDFILPGALAKVVAKLDGDPSLGQVHCFPLEVDEEGEATRKSVRAQRRALVGLHDADFDYRRQTVILGMVANHLRTYRRGVLDEVGRFEEGLEFGEDYEMALRILDRHEIAAVPEFLYCRRVHGGNASANLRLAALRFWLQRWRMIRRLRRSGAVSFLYWKGYGGPRSRLAGLAHALGIANAYYRARRGLHSRGGVRGAALHALRPPATRLYYAALERLSWWPLDWARRQRRPSGRRIGYYLWRFPLVSETFILREIRALEDQGFEVRVFADGAGDLQLADEDARALLAKTEFLEPQRPLRTTAYRRHFFRTNPLAYLNVMLYVLVHRYDYWKTLKEDRAVFRTVVYLAGMLKDRGIEHLHTPWANRCAFIAILAAKLVGIRCSVQARAHELHRIERRHGLQERLSEADFVITNCRYNEAFIRSWADRGESIHLHAIYEGVDLSRFDSDERSWELSGPLRVLCVARLAEQKGLEHLLRACAQLRLSGMNLDCEIIGGPDEDAYFEYHLQLVKLHRSLALEDCVDFRGAQSFPVVLDALRKADLFVLPCVIERGGGCDITPNSLIEAMAMRLPVVSTTISAIPEIVEHGVSGLLVPPGDPDRLAGAIAALAGDAALRERLGQGGRRRVEQRFDINSNIARFAEVFRGEGA